MGDLYQAKRFRKGDLVEFTTKEGELIKGRVVRNNKRRVTVDQVPIGHPDSSSYLVPPSKLRYRQSIPEDDIPDPRPKASDFSVKDPVKFTDKNGQVMRGTVTKVKQVKLEVTDGHLIWDVRAEFVEKMSKEEADLHGTSNLWANLFGDRRRRQAEAEQKEASKMKYEGLRKVTGDLRNALVVFRQEVYETFDEEDRRNILMLEDWLDRKVEDLADLAEEQQTLDLSSEKAEFEQRVKQTIIDPYTGEEEEAGPTVYLINRSMSQAVCLTEIGGTLLCPGEALGVKIPMIGNATQQMIERGVLSCEDSLPEEFHGTA